MLTIIQQIETYWTKKSRGNPNATKRNAVPEYCPLEDLPEQFDIYLQQVKFNESSAFESPSISAFRAINQNQQLELGFKLETIDGQLQISKKRDGGKQFISRDGSMLSPICQLEPNSWMRVIINERTPLDYTWAYYKQVYNIFYGQRSAIPKLHASKSPVLILDKQKNLW